MSVMDSTLALFLRSFNIRSKELSQTDALKYAADLPRFFAIELNYKGTPVRMIVAASTVPDGMIDGDAEKLPAAVVATEDPQK